MRNTTGRRVVAYAILSREFVRTPSGTTVRSEGGIMEDVAIDLFVTAIGPNQERVVVRRGRDAAGGQAADMEFRIGAVLFEDGRLDGAEPWLSELRERREFTYLIAKEVAAAVEGVRGGSLTQQDFKALLARLKTELQSRAKSAGGRRLCEAFLSDVAGEIDRAERNGDPAAGLSGLARAQAIRLDRMKPWGLQ